MSTFRERQAARRAAYALENARITAALEAHKRHAQDADYREYAFTHRAPNAEPTDVDAARYVFQRLTARQNAAHRAVREQCACDNATSHV